LDLFCSVRLGRERRTGADDGSPPSSARLQLFEAKATRRYFAGRNATWIWIAMPGGGSNPKTSVAL
jgi:hypothetical protein